MKLLSILKRIKSGALPDVKYMVRRVWYYAGIHSARYGTTRLRVFLSFVISALLYGCDCDDYFLYEFYYLNHRGKKRFMICSDQHNFESHHTDPKQEAIAADKEQTLIHFHEYMKRDWCGIKNNNTEADYSCFFEKHTYGVLKPVMGMGGHGVEIVNLKERFKNANEFREYCMKNGLIAEEKILQHTELNKIYANSINTIRMLTLKGKPVGAAIRMGVGNSVVDNASSGGIYTEIDIDEGITVGKAMKDVTREQFVVHPTTKTVIPGIKIPFWNECKEIAEKASKIIPDVYSVGWDIAVTPDGPTFVEVNTNVGLELIQAPNGHSLKPAFEKIKD